MWLSAYPGNQDGGIAVYPQIRISRESDLRIPGGADIRQSSVRSIGWFPKDSQHSGDSFPSQTQLSLFQGMCADSWLLHSEAIMNLTRHILNVCGR
jgi:hypothetical protein